MNSHHTERFMKKSTSNTRKLNTSACDAVPCQDDASMLILKNKHSLCEDLKFVISMPELCDVIFLVGESQQPVYGVRAILATRSRQFYQLFLKEYNSVAYKKKQTVPKKVLSRLRSKSSTNSKHTRCKFPGKLTIPIHGFDVETFRRVIRYAHCGTVHVDTKSAIGLLHAAHAFGFDDLHKACWDFTIGCIKQENIDDLMTSARRYMHFKTTTVILQKIAEYNQTRKATHGNEQTVKSPGNTSIRRLVEKRKVERSYSNQHMCADAAKSVTFAPHNQEITFTTDENISRTNDTCMESSDNCNDTTSRARTASCNQQNAGNSSKIITNILCHL